MSGFHDQLVTWSNGNDYLLSACEMAIGFLPALVIGYLCFRIFKRYFPDQFGPLSSWHFALLFSCACWSLLFFFWLFGSFEVDPANWLRFLFFLPIAELLLSPIAAIVGIPSVLIYTFRRPLLGKPIIYGLATTTLVLSYCYHLWLYRLSIH